MPRGGLRNPPGGRPLGSKNKLPGGKAFTEQLKTVVKQYEDNEYLSTGPDKEFKGSALEFIQSIMRCETIDVKTRLYATSKAVEYEPRLVEPREGSPDLEENRRWISEQLSRLAAAEGREKERKQERTAAAPVKAPVQYIAPREVTVPEPPQSFNSNGKAQKGFIVLFTDPFRAFKPGSRKVYEADSSGEVYVDESETADVDDLIRAGCRLRR
jgi:hypothetical protein